MQPIPTSPLRPLGLGEVLDRAVTLCVKHAVVLTLIAVVLLVPLGLTQFFGLADQTKFLTGLNEILQASQAGKPPPDSAMQKILGQSVFNGWTIGYFVLILFVSPLTSAALVAAVSALYLGRPITLGEAYRTALGRWLHVIGINVMFLIVAGIAYVVAGFLGVILFFGLFAIGSSLRNVAIGLGIIVGLAFLVVLIAAAMIGTLAWKVSLITCVVERANFVVAFSSGLRRVISGVGLRRALLVGLAYFAITIGISIVAGVGSIVLYGVVQNHVLGQAFAVLIQLATAAFITAFLTIFYFDLRVREEGFDLQLAANATVPNDALTTA